MIERARLLADLKAGTRRLEDDLRARSEDDAEVKHVVREQYREARAAGRTDRSYEEWREDLLAQVAVGWVLGTVFVRFCEDNRLWPEPLLSGQGTRRDLARDHRTHWLSQHPASGDRDWLLEVFGRYRVTPATSGVFGAHNPLWQFGPTDDGARGLLELWWAVDPETGVLVHDFSDEGWDTRFLGDLYQDLSEHAKDTFALLQTPEFVEEFILDRTLDPAVATFGLQTVRLIDPTCGSGHFLLGAFHRLRGLWQEREPATSARTLAQRALDAVHGVDLNPFAVAVARFRLLVAALQASSITDLRSAPDFHIHVATGDSLLHGRLSNQLFVGTEARSALLAHRYPTEDAEEANRLLEAGRYHAVVGNPPYITVKEPALRDAYRELYDTASGKYSLGVPFTERFFDLAQSASHGEAAGFVGMITTNSFMKRGFGKKLIESFLSTLDLTHVIDTSGAYIPGHGTPTVILFGRPQRPATDTIRAVLGIRGEPGTPDDPSEGRVWRSIVDMLDDPGSENEFVSVEDMPRKAYRKHPWGLQGGAAPEVKRVIETAAAGRMSSGIDSIGFLAITGEDDLFSGWTSGSLVRHLLLPPTSVASFVTGDLVRDWRVGSTDEALFPYDQSLTFSIPERAVRLAWPYRRLLEAGLMFSKTRSQRGLGWAEYAFLSRDRAASPYLITFAFVATHNHFVLDRGGKVFKQSAPVIKLPPDATEDDHLRLLELLNSSTACFWMKQVFHNKGSTVDAHGARQTTIAFENFWEHDGTKLQQFPIPSATPLERARAMDALAQELDQTLPAKVLEREPPTREALDTARARGASLRARMVALQEEMDWECYHLYGLNERPIVLPTDQLPELQRGERAFEIALARAIAAGQATSTWFERHGTTPITELPASWPAAYRTLVEQRIALLASDRKIGLLERPEYKRRWNWEAWEALEQAALRNWLLDRLEALPVWKEAELQTVGRLADQVARDPEAVEAARLLTGRRDVDLPALLGTLVEDESVPYLAPLRFKASGRRKRLEWEGTWELQRVEDEIDARAALPDTDPRHLSPDQASAEKVARGVDRIAIPPKYTSADFARTSWWQHRGKLDVPKERFISYPGTRAGADTSAVVGWAGWDHLHRARALAAHYQQRKDAGGDPSELTALLAGLEELVPWLVQWHNDLHPDFRQRMGDFFRTYVDGEARTLGLTSHDLRRWTP